MARKRKYVMTAARKRALKKMLAVRWGKKRKRTKVAKRKKTSTKKRVYRFTMARKRALKKAVKARWGKRRRTISRKTKRKSSHNPGTTISLPNPGRKKTMARRTRAFVQTATGRAIMDGFTIGSSALVSTGIVNMMPMIKDQNPWIKALIQAGGGAAVVGTARDPMMKRLGAGAVVGGAITLLIPIINQFFPNLQLFGARKLSQRELSAMTMGIPRNQNYTPRQMGIPRMQNTYANNNTMGRRIPANNANAVMGAHEWTPGW